MNNKKYYVKVLPKQICYKVENGIASNVPLRLGRLNDNLYRDRKVINTIYGEQIFRPKVEIKTLTPTDKKSYIIVTIFNNDTNVTVKEFVIRAQQNKLTLMEMKDIYDKIVSSLEDNKTIIEVIELITSLKNNNDEPIIVEEYC